MNMIKHGYLTYIHMHNFVLQFLRYFWKEKPSHIFEAFFFFNDDTSLKQFRKL